MTTTQTDLEILPSALYSILLTVKWGIANVARYCRSTTDIVSNGQTFTACPTLRAVFSKPLDGGTDDADMELQMPMNVTPFNYLSSPYTFAKTDVVIEEIIPGDDSTRQEMFSGRITKVTASPRSNPLMCSSKIGGVKARLKNTIGLQALTTCPWLFGSSNNSPCQIDDSTITHTGCTVSSINTDGISNRVTITFPGTPPTYDNVTWNRGSIIVDGLGITIRSSLGGGKFDLREIPPPQWQSAGCTAKEGCDKQISTCRAKNNEAQFGGAGYSLPRYNPIIAQG